MSLVKFKSNLGCTSQPNPRMIFQKSDVCSWESPKSLTYSLRGSGDSGGGFPLGAPLGERWQSWGFPPVTHDARVAQLHALVATLMLTERDMVAQ